MLDLNNKVNNGGTTAAGQLDADEWNQLPSEVQSAIESAGITLSGGDLTQLVKSIAHYSSVGQFFTGGGIADAYTAAIIAPRIAPSSLINGMELNLIIPATNTGATTLNAFGTGAVDVKLEGGSLNPVAGDMESGKLARFKYLTSPSAHWEIVNAKVSNGATQSETDAGVIDTKFVSPKKMRFGFAVLLATNGYITFPSWMGGFVIQWGINVVSNTATLTTFTTPIAFPSLFFQAVAVHDFPAATNTFTTSIESVSLSELRARVWGDNTSNIRWIAIGH